MHGVEPHSPRGRSFQEVTEPLRPATIRSMNRPARTCTRTREVRARHARCVTPRAFRERTTRIERASPDWRSGALPLSYVRVIRPAGVEPAPSAVAGQRSRSTELRACVRRRSLRQESNPHLGLTGGACLPLNTTEAMEWRRRELEPAPPRCKRGALPDELHPHWMRTDGVEPPQHEAAALQAGELTNAQRPRDEGDRPDLNRRCGDHEWGREPGRDSNPRSRAHEAREDSRSSTAQVSTPGETRTRTFRDWSPPTTASSPVRPRGR